MKRALLFGAALFLGIAAGEWGTRNFAFRAALGRLMGRGDLVQLVGSRGIYAQDPARSGRSLEQLISAAKIEAAAAHQPVNQAAVQHELNLLRASLPNEKAWEALLARAGTNPSRLRAEVAENLRARAWLEARVAAAKPPTTTKSAATSLGTRQSSSSRPAIARATFFWPRLMVIRRRSSRRRSG